MSMKKSDSKESVNPLSSHMTSTVIQDTTVPTVINDVEYALQSRTIKKEDGTIQHLYRVLLGEEVIKSWTEGDMGKYFGLKK